LGDDPSVEDIVDALFEGRDPELGVRWRLVDDASRPIPLEGRALGRGRSKA
jgi:hypothetical protein